MGGRGDKLAQGNRRGVQARGDQSRDMGDITHDHRSDLVGGLPESGEVDRPGVGAGTDNDHLGTMLLRQVHHLVVIDRFRLPVDTVGNDFVVFTGEIGGTAVRKVAAVGQIHPENRVARLQDGKVHRHVGLGSRMGLHVDIVGAEKGLATLDGQIFHDIDELAAAVVPIGRIALGVLVGHDATLGLQNGFTDEVFRSDQFDLARLSFRLPQNSLGHFRICFGQFWHGSVPFPLFSSISRILSRRR